MTKSCLLLAYGSGSGASNHVESDDGQLACPKDSVNRNGDSGIDAITPLLVEAVGCTPTASNNSVWNCVLDRLYEDGGANAFDGTQALGSQGGEGVYGEILPDNLQALLDAMSFGVPLGQQDWFVDLGSGSGRSVVQAFVSIGMSALGVELSDTRHGFASAALSRLCKVWPPAISAPDCVVSEHRAELQADGRSLRFVHDDMLSADLGGSTVMYLNSVCFSDALLRATAQRLANLALGTIVASFKMIPGPAAGLMLVKKIHVATTFQRSTQTYIYVVVPHFAWTPFDSGMGGPLESAILEEWTHAAGAKDRTHTTVNQLASHFQKSWADARSDQALRCAVATGSSSSSLVSRESFRALLQCRWQGNARSVLQRFHSELAFSVSKGEQSLGSTVSNETLFYVAPDGKTLLHVARGTTKEMTDFLLRQRMDANVAARNGASPLHIAVSEGNLDMAHVLIGARANINAPRISGATPLFDALDALPSVRESVVGFLLDQGANATSRDRAGQTPLSASVRAGHGSVAKFLLEHRAEVLALANDGSTPLHEAQTGEVATLLLRAPNGMTAAGLANRAGRTPLETAFLFGRTAVANLLADHAGAAACTEGPSEQKGLGLCLHRAVSRNNSDLVAWLLEHGAPPDSVDELGKSAYAVARALNYDHIASILA